MEFNFQFEMWILSLAESFQINTPVKNVCTHSVSQSTLRFWSENFLGSQPQMVGLSFLNWINRNLCARFMAQCLIIYVRLSVLVVTVHKFLITASVVVACFFGTVDATHECHELISVLIGEHTNTQKMKSVSILNGITWFERKIGICYKWSDFFRRRHHRSF